MTTIYTMSSGVATDALDLADRLDVFLTEYIGWVRQYTVDSGVSTRDRVYYNNGGEESNPYNDMYARWKGLNTGIIYQYAYSYYSVLGVYSDEMGGTAATSNPGAYSGPCKYWLLGNKDVVWVLTCNTTSGTYYSSSIGYCDSYYCPSYDALPVVVVGQEVDSKTFVDNRVLMYNRLGAPAPYVSENYSLLVQHGTPQERDGSYFGMGVVLRNDVVGERELRGELFGAKQIYGSDFVSENILVVSGTSEQYFVLRHDNNYQNTFAYGPFSTIV